MTDLATFSNAVITFVATYFVHSTLLLVMCWLIVPLACPKSHFLAERMWKLAAVLGILTAVSQMFVGANTFPIVMQSLTDGGGAARELISQGDRLRDIPGRNALPSATVETISDPFGPGAEIEDGGEKATKLNDPPLESKAESVSLVDGKDSVVQIVASAEALAASAHDAKEEPPGLTSEQDARNWLPVLLHCCAIVLVCASVAGGLLLIVQTARLCLRIGTARVLRTGTARDILDRFLKRHKIRGRIRLLASDQHCEPIAYGLFQWTIVLPEGAEDRLQRSELKALLAHEVAHLVRGDMRWLWIGRVLCTCCAFQPLNFLARRHWQQAAEYLCDDWALERGIPSLSLARCLTRVAEWRFGVETSKIGLAAGGSKATLVQRVRRLVNEQPPSDAWKSPWRRRALTMSAAVTAVVLVGFVPRIALPLAPADEHVSHSNLASVDEPVTGNWRVLEEELLRLEMDLERVGQLRRGDDAPELDSYFEILNQRAASLQARRQYIASLIEKESQR